VTGRLALRTLLVAAALAIATTIAWWGVPAAAAVFGALTWRDRGGPVVAGFAAIVAWGGLLIWDAANGPVGAVAATLGALLKVHAAAVYALTLAFAGLLAVCAAIVARSVARLSRGAAV
jgi:hypothetical protein